MRLKEYLLIIKIQKKSYVLPKFLNVFTVKFSWQTFVFNLLLYLRVSVKGT